MPVIVGGGGAKKTPALAAKFATEYNTSFGSLEEIAARLSRVRAACESAGRDPSTLTLSMPGSTAVGATTTQAKRRAEAIGSGLTELQDGGGFGVLADLGITRVYFQILDLHDLDHLEFLASEVVPHFG